LFSPSSSSFPSSPPDEEAIPLDAEVLLGAVGGGVFFGGRGAKAPVEVGFVACSQIFGLFLDFSEAKCGFREF